MYREPIAREEYVFSLGQFAYIWGMAAVVGAQLRLTLTQPLPEGQERDDWDFSAELNHLGGAKALSTADNRTATGYNNDTLYGVGFFDLELEPYVITSPDFGDRYWVTMISDLYNDVVGNIGSLTTGTSAPPTFIVGPKWEGELPDIAKIVHRVPTRYALVASRIYVDGNEDLPAAHELQSEVDVIPLGKFMDPDYEFESLPQRPLRPEDSKVTEDLAFFEALGNVIREQPPRVDEEYAILGILREIGITPERGFAYEEIDPITKVGLRRGIYAAQALISEKTRILGSAANGWSFNLDTGRTGNDYLLRAALAIDIPFTNVPEEAVYMTCREDAEGEMLTGESNYVIRFEPDGLPPVDAFWSVTLYDADGFMVRNPIDRYSIGDRTLGIRPSADGAIEIFLQNEQPQDASNWLPAPEGEFYLYLRCYLPQPKLLSGEWTPPAVQRVS